MLFENIVNSLCVEVENKFLNFEGLFLEVLCYLQCNDTDVIVC